MSTVATPAAKIHNALDARYENALARLEQAANAIKTGNKELIEALDTVIPVAIEKAIANKNCNPLNKIVKALRNANLKSTNKIIADFTAYCHSQTGLGMPPDTVFFVKALNQFSCRINVMETWITENPGKLDNAITLSQWLNNRKAEKKEIPLTDKINKAAHGLLKIIEDYGLHREDTLYENIKELLETVVKK